VQEESEPLTIEIIKPKKEKMEDRRNVLNVEIQRDGRALEDQSLAAMREVSMSHGAHHLGRRGSIQSAGDLTDVWPNRDERWRGKTPIDSLHANPSWPAKERGKRMGLGA